MKPFNKNNFSRFWSTKPAWLLSIVSFFLLVLSPLIILYILIEDNLNNIAEMYEEIFAVLIQNYEEE